MDTTPSTLGSRCPLSNWQFFHSKHLSVEVSSNQYADVQQGLDRLEFAILPLDLTVIENHELLGGRYCSIQGRLATQLKLKHKKTGNVKTLYVTRLTESLSDVHTQTTTPAALPSASGKLAAAYLA